jgi:hypothetical protein
MKRFLSIVVILGALGYFAHRYWPTIAPTVEPIVQPVISAVTGEPARQTGELPLPPQLPRTGQVAPPGFLYMLERASKNTNEGVVAVIPGEQVRLMQRMSGGRVRITTGKHDFEVKESQVTKDYDLAQAARYRAGIPLR